MAARSLVCLILLGACGSDASVTPPTPDARPSIDGAVAAGSDAPAGAPDARLATPDGSVAMPDAPAASLPDAGPVPTITSVSIVETPASTQLRQGQLATLVVSGTNLDAFLSVDLGVGFLGVTSVSESRVELFANLLGGETLGAHTLVIHSLERADAIFPNAITVTPVTVTQDGDDANIGTPDSPLRTLTAGLLANGTGNTVALGPGDYQDGEANQPRVKATQTLIGAGAEQTTIRRSLVVELGGTIQGATILGTQSECVFDDVNLGAGSTTLRDLVLDECGTGVFFQGAATLTNITVRSVGGTGITLAPALSAEVVLDTVDISAHDRGVGVSLNGKVMARLHHVSISGGTDYGLVVGGSAQITLRDSDIATLHGAFGDHSTAVWVTSDGALLDFGNGSEPGGNTLTGDIWSLKDDRDARAAADGPILTISGSTLGDVLIPPAVYTGPATQGYLSITGAGNRVQVF